MTWSWSHAPEAYESGRKKLSKKGLGWLIICLAEWRSTDFKRPDVMDGPEFDADRYGDELDKIKDDDYALLKADVSRAARIEVLAEEIWGYAEQLRECTDGGHEAHVCPYGCHRVAW